MGGRCRNCCTGNGSTEPAPSSHGSRSPPCPTRQELGRRSAQRHQSFLPSAETHKTRDSNDTSGCGASQVGRWNVTIPTPPPAPQGSSSLLNTAYNRTWRISLKETPRAAAEGRWTEGCILQPRGGKSPRSTAGSTQTQQHRPHCPHRGCICPWAGRAGPWQSPGVLGQGCRRAQPQETVRVTWLL